MKSLKYLSIASILLLSGCFQEDIYEPELPTNNLEIKEQVGLKLESVFATEEVAMNVKTETSGIYIVKIIHLSGRIVSKEEVKVQAGDNILKLYTGALPKEPYTIALYNTQNVKLAETIVNLY
ncbi:MAG: hypothetical protein ACO239_07430 [Sediminibacterium sp.]